MEQLISTLSSQQIARFFSRVAPLTQLQCNQEAERIAGETGGHPAIVQGGSSYTFITENFAIQFREACATLDLELLEHVEQAYAGFTPHHASAGKLGEVYVYKMNNISGISMYLARSQLHAHECYLLQQTLRDFARFFASAWHNTPARMVCPRRDVLLADYSSQLLQLRLGLPERFHESLDYLIPRLPSLFDSDWPLVPNHTDLLENNIHVNLETGKLTGICDWKDTEISPFGMSLGGLETMLGIHRLKGWCYHSNQQQLRELFWEVFSDTMGSGFEQNRERIEVARLVGLFLANGFAYDHDEKRIPASDGDVNLAYLEAVVLGHLVSD